MLWAWTSDLRIAARSLLRMRGFAVLAVMTLAAGFALNTGVFAVVNAYLLSSLPYPGAERLYNVRYGNPEANQFPPPGMDKLNWSALSGIVEHAIAWDLDAFFLTGGDHPQQVRGAWTTPGFMEGLGVRVAMGRNFSAGDYLPGSPQVALISHELWSTRFSANPNIVGEKFSAFVSDRPNEAEMFTIIGVLPAKFWHLNPFTEVLAPLRVPTFPYMVKLRPGVSPADAERRIVELVSGGLKTAPDFRVRVVSTHGEYVTRIQPMLQAVGGAAIVVLLIACANVAFLLLIRAAKRQKEMSLRLALGAGRAEIARLLVAEALLLGGTAAALGLAISSALLKQAAPAIQQQLGRSVPGGDAALAVDWRVALLAALCCLLTALFFTAAPLMVSWKANLAETLRAMTAGAGESKASTRARSVLIGLEVAGSLALLAACGLMIRSVVQMLNVDWGVQAERVMTAGIGLRQRSHPTPAALAQFYDRALPNIHAIPGVEAAAVASGWIMQQPQPLPVRAVAGGPAVNSGVIAVSPGYLSTLQMQLRAGRFFEGTDVQGGNPVAVISESLARALFPAGDWLNGRILVEPQQQGNAPPPAPVWRSVVGVVNDVRQLHTDEILADVYVPLAQSPTRFAALYVRTAASAGVPLSLLRRALNDVDREASLQNPRTLGTWMDQERAGPRFLAWLLAGFSVFATALALLGVYSVVAYSIRQREREIAIRMALGADARQVTGLFVRQGGTVLAVGIVGGLLGAVWLGSALRTQLHHVSSSDPVTFAAAGAIFGLAGLAAVWWPSRKAARTDPALALREER